MQILVLPHVHSDLCWSDIPEVCIDSYMRYVDDAIEFISASKDYRFTLEHAVVLKEFLRRKPLMRDEVKRVLEQGNLDCGAFYTGPTELTLGGEGLIRELYLGKLWMEKEFGVSPRTAWNVDAPGHIGQLPQILSKAGIECFFLWKSFFSEKDYGGYVEPHYFTWRSPDGSEITTCSTPYGYGLGDLVRIKGDYETFEAALPPYIDRIRDETIAYDIPQYVLVADSNDDTDRLSRGPVANVARWNSEHPDSPMRLVSSTEFAEALRACDLPVSSGEMPCWWDTVMTFETERVLVDRWGEGKLLSAECAAAMAAAVVEGYTVPYYDIEAAWEARLFAGEHNEGGHKGNLSDMLKEYKVKSASHLAFRTGRLALDAIAEKIGPAQDTGFVLFNPLSWQRKCEARLNFEFQHNDFPPHDPYTRQPILTDKAIRGFDVVDSEGAEVPVEVISTEIGSDGALRKASVTVGVELDGGAYASYRLRPKDALPTCAVKEGANVIENELYRVEMARSCGALVSIYDKTRERELLDVSKYLGAELITNEDLGHDETEEFTGRVWRMRDYPASRIHTAGGALRNVLRSEGEMIGCHRSLEVSLRPDSDSIFVTVGVDWHGVRDLNMRIAFPFSLFVPVVNYGVPFGYVEYEQEHPDCTNIHASIRGVRDWFDLSDRDFGITVATEVIPVDFADRLEPQSMQPLAQPMLLRSTYSCFDHQYYNNRRPIDVKTNRNTPCLFNKGGKFEFHFVLRPHSGPADLAQAARLSWELLHPPVTAYIDGVNLPYATAMRAVSKAVKSGQGELPSAGVLIRSESENVIHTVTKPAERGEGIVLRMYDASGEGGAISFEFCKPIREAHYTDILENNMTELPFDGCKVQLDVPPFSIETIRVVLRDSCPEA